MPTKNPKPRGMSAMLIIGNQPETITTAARAIVDVLKAAETEGARIAAANALSQIAQAPHAITISGCSFEAGKG